MKYKEYKKDDGLKMMAERFLKNFPNHQDSLYKDCYTVEECVVRYYELINDRFNKA